jgi:hypothetical protein
MFEKVEALDKNKHQDLKLSPLSSYEFARNLNMVPLSYTEIIPASKHYPIIFPAQGTMVPHALFALAQGENVFVDESGTWLAPYVPAHIRRYPFILAQTGEEGHYAVCIDPDAPHFSTEQGDPLYTANFEPSETLSKAIEFLKRYQQEMADTEKLFAEFADRGLLADRQFTVEQGGQKSTVGGFKAVDESRLKEVEDDKLADWLKRGLMGLVYAHLFSLDKAQKLVKR